MENNNVVAFSDLHQVLTTDYGFTYLGVKAGAGVYHVDSQCMVAVVKRSNWVIFDSSVSKSYTGIGVDELRFAVETVYGLYDKD